MSRPAQSNPNSRSVHTKNSFSSKNAFLHIKTNLINRNPGYRRKSSASLIEQQNSDHNSHPIVFKSKKNKDFIVTDAVLKSEGTNSTVISRSLFYSSGLALIFDFIIVLPPRYNRCTGIRGGNLCPLDESVYDILLEVNSLSLLYLDRWQVKICLQHVTTQ